MSDITDLRQEVYDDFKVDGLIYESTLRKKTIGAYNTSTGQRTITNIDTTCYTAFKRILRGKGIPKYYEIKEADKMCDVATNGIVPEKGDQLIISDDTYSIELVFDVSAGAAALFEMIIR